jgi:hypothetical protein
LKPAATRDDTTIGISGNWIGKAEGFDGCPNLVDLALWIGARIARIRSEIAYRQVGDGQSRRLDRRNFVHVGAPENQLTDAGSRRFSIKMQSSSVQDSARRSAQGGAGQVMASQNGGSDERASLSVVFLILSPVRRHKCLMCVLQRLFLRFKRLLCRITGKWLSPPVTFGDPGGISGSRAASTGQKPVIWRILKKIPVLRRKPGETGSHVTAHTTIRSR